MRSRVAIAIAKRERERLGRAEPIVTTTTTKKTKKATKSKKFGLADVTVASLDTEVADQVVAGDPKTMEATKPE